MTSRHALAVVVALMSFAVVLAQPLWIRTTGDEVYLDVRPVDPLSFFRGNYMDVRYRVEFDSDAFDPREPDLQGAVMFEPPPELDPGKPNRVFVRFAKGRPATPLGITTERPALGPDEFCVRGRTQGRWSIDFPEIEQLFVTPERARVIESAMNDSVAVVRVTGSCRAQIVDIEPR